TETSPSHRHMLALRAILLAIGLALMSFQSAARGDSKPANPANMKWIAGGEFTMGTDDPQSVANERPSHRVKVDGFWIDEHDVTNAEFRRFVEATGYLTTAEKAVDWNELKKELPPGTPKPDDSMLAPGSMVFTPPDHAVPLDDVSGWWRWVTGTNWRHPGGPSSDLSGKDEHPVVQ